MDIRVRKDGNVTVLELDGKLTMGDGDVKMSETIQKLLHDGVRWFILDMSRVPYMDSAGLGELMRSNKRVREKQGAIRLVLSAKTREVLTIAAVITVFDLFPDAKAAVADFGS